MNRSKGIKLEEVRYANNQELARAAMTADINLKTEEGAEEASKGQMCLPHFWQMCLPHFCSDVFYYH